MELNENEFEPSSIENNNIYTKLSKNYVNIILIGIVLIILIIFIVIFLNGKNKDEGKKYR